jgi:hypothetical protein
MRNLKSFVILVASAAFFIVVAAEAQTPGAVTNHAFAIGKGAGTTGYNSVLCSSAQIPVGQTAADPQCKTVSGDISLSSSGATAIVPGSANTVKGTLDGVTTSNLAITSCSVAYRFTQWVSGTGWQCGISPILPSRTIAATLDLSAFNAITTQGYASAGDGGDATFIKTSGRFLDTVVSSGTISAAGTGYTNGSYLYVPLTGSATGIATYANVTVAGGVVSAVTILDVNGRGAASLAGDVLTTANANIGGTGSGFTWTVSTVTTALASFTDSAGNRFQYVVGSGININPRQFSCKFDWLGVDATATDDGACLQASLNFASITRYVRQDFGGTLASTRVMLPAGTAKICQGLVLPGATQLFGQGPFNSIIKVCDSGLSSGTHIITACDINAHVACFGPQIGQLGINAFNAAGSNNTYAIFSNAAQQARFIDNVNIYSGARGCVGYDVGYGGAALVTVYDLFCTINTGSANSGVTIGATTGTTIIKFFNSIIESGGAGLTGNAFNILNGVVHIDGFHSEGITNGINVNITTATHSLVVMNATGGANCTQLVTLQGTNIAGNFAIFNAIKQGACTNLVNNGQGGGASRAADAMPKDGWVFFNP